MKETISVIGLGYVGLPVAMAMSRKFPTLGFDINTRRVQELRDGHDRTDEISSQELKSSTLKYCTRIEDLREATAHIVTVPTPIDSAHRPDLSAMFSASELVGQVLKKGDIVIYESTVYPGVTEEECAPILERVSKLRSGVDFHVGYSPERINPGDKTRSFTTIRKVVAAQDEKSLQRVAHIYGSVVEAGIFKAKSIRVAEAAKVIENTQRDLNIALINELSLIFHRLGINTHDVLEAASTKWNFLNFQPGLVGGHCIGVDPYYLTHKAEQVGFIPQVILAGRKTNDDMGRYVAQSLIREMILEGCKIQGSVVTVLGLTFKENCPDIRNSKVADVIRELQSYGVEVQVSDPLADKDDAAHEYGVTLTPFEYLKKADGIVLAVAHKNFSTLTLQDFKALSNRRPVIADVKGLLRAANYSSSDARIWTL